jgi:hypothetical protein
MPPLPEPWRPEVNWDTPAGRVLDKLVKALPPTPQWKIIIFGSSPLQLSIDPTFLSADVDVIPSANIEEHCRRAKLLKGQTEVYIDPCAPAAFTASADWPVRAYEVQRGHVTFVLPHPIDILVSKIKRLEDKDLQAFRLVRAKTGHPTEDELVHALRRAVDVYRPSFDEEAGGDPRHNTVVLWRELFNKPINVGTQIIGPALEERRRNYGPQGHELRDALRKVN